VRVELDAIGFGFLMKACRSTTSKPMWLGETRERVFLVFAGTRAFADDDAA